MAEQLKLPEVAQRLGVSEKTARRYVKAGTLPSVFVGGAYRVSEEDLQAFLQEARVAPDGGSPKRSGRLSVEWALSSAGNDTFHRVIADASPQALRSLIEKLVGDYQPRLFEDVRGKKPSPDDVRRVLVFSCAYSIAEELRRRGEEAPKSYILALRRHLNALAADPSDSPAIDHELEGQAAG